MRRISHRLRAIWRAAPVASSLFTGAILAALVFGALLLSSCEKDHFRADQSIAPWMTPGYIAHVYRLPKDLVLSTLNAPVPPPDGPMSLAELAEYTGEDLADLVARAQALVDAAPQKRGRK